jgi:hypothetical protein
MRTTTAAFAFLATCIAYPMPNDMAQSSPKITDVDILQYALTLEHLGTLTPDAMHSIQLMPIIHREQVLP